MYRFVLVPAAGLYACFIPPADACNAEWCSDRVPVANKQQRGHAVL
jgi:hypothetical protein